jgi:2',5'-phosphodiesterase
MRAGHKVAISFISPILYTARAMTHMPTAVAKFHGRVVARNLPSGRNGEVELRSKPINRLIDPANLLPGCGPLHHRPVSPRVEPLPQTVGSVDLREPTTGAASDGLDWTTLHVFVYGNKEGPFQETLCYQMNRDADEEVEKSLKRMEITLSKKLKGKTKTSDRNKESTSTESLSPSIYRLDPETLEPSEEWTDAISMANRDFWGRVRQNPAVVRMPANDTTLDLLLEYNPPSIMGVQTFDELESHLYVGVPLMVDVDLLFCDECEFSWFVDGGLVQQGEEPSYTPKSSDAGGSLSLLLRPTRKEPFHDGHGCEEAYWFPKMIEEPPENYLLSLRPLWVSPRDQASRKNLRVVTYNILADQNAFEASNVPSRSYRSYLSADILLRKRRMPLILHELLAYQSDVICLQEVDRGVFEGLFEPVLRQIGYEGYFSGKASQGSVEGCAMFWSLESFESLPESLRETHKLRELMPSPEVADEDWPSSKPLAELLDQRPDLHKIVTSTLGHIVQLAPLTPRGTTDRLWVSNTHLFFHPDASHIRTLQAYGICQQIARNLVDRPGALVACGDYNANLTDPAGRIFVERYVPSNAKYLKKDLNKFYWGQRMGRCTEEQKFDTDFPEIQLPEDTGLFPVMRSALDEAAPVTHFVPGFHGTLDHILVGGAKAKPVRSAPMPSMRDLGRDTAMPSKHLPSDHVSLVAEIFIK